MVSSGNFPLLVLQLGNLQLVGELCWYTGMILNFPGAPQSTCQCARWKTSTLQHHRMWALHTCSCKELAHQGMCLRWTGLSDCKAPQQSMPGRAASHKLM
jgi:hypothetical protein